MKRGIEVVGDFEEAAVATERAYDRSRERHETSYRPARALDHDLFTGRHPAQEPREMSLGLVNADLCHRTKID